MMNKKLCPKCVSPVTAGYRGFRNSENVAIYGYVPINIQAKVLETVKSMASNHFAGISPDSISKEDTIKAVKKLFDTVNSE